MHVKSLSTIIEELLVIFISWIEYKQNSSAKQSLEAMMISVNVTFTYIKNSFYSCCFYRVIWFRSDTSYYHLLSSLAFNIKNWSTWRQYNFMENQRKLISCYIPVLRKLLILSIMWTHNLYNIRDSGHIYLNIRERLTQLNDFSVLKKLYV